MRFPKWWISLFAVVCLAAGLGFTAVPASTPQDNAKQVDHQPSTFYWAVLVGISEYAGNTADLQGSAADANSIRDHLKSLGWRDDHIYVLTDGSATRANIVKAIRWLADKTNERSAAVFHFSGHEQPFHTSSDGDNESRDVALRTHENKFIIDGDLGAELEHVRANRFWIDLSLCRAGGFNDSGTVQKGRVITYSSPEKELSYEDTGYKHSVFSYFSIVEGMRNKRADRNKDGKVSVEEAFWYSRDPVIDRTDGRQHPVMTDKLDGEFSITPPPASKPKPKPTPTPTPSPTCVVPGVCLP